MAHIIVSNFDDPRRSTVRRGSMFARACHWRSRRCPVGWARPQLLPLEPTDLRTCAMNALRPASYLPTGGRLQRDYMRTSG
jgi:hypothetical protein